MKYVFVSYNYSPDFKTPESWFKRTEGYTGVLEHLGKDNAVINVKQIDYEGIRLHNGVQHHFVDFGKRKTYFPWRLNNYVKNLDAGIVVVQGLHHPLQLMQLRLLLNKKTKLIAQHHAEKPFTGLKKYVQRLADVFVHAYLFASKDIGMDWVTKGNLSSAAKIHEVMEISSIFYEVDKRLSKQKSRAIGNPVFLWVGRLNTNKDPLNVVKAFLRFSETNPAARLYMIYQTDELLNNLKVLLENNECKSAVSLIGQVPHQELIYWFNSADFFISGSHYEGSGTAVCEAMSCGCVPVVTDIPSFRMITDNRNCGILYEAGNEDALFDALTQTSQPNIAEKRQKSLDYFQTNLSFGAIANRIHEIAGSL